ncbi:MAG TPA: sigma-70 family RNA polymerase sigma factor [Longimicrobiaceae bacterium]|nr:sigma-70 family RNA polymerase sigma factor [Longimicrobiaceae bacterium]
MTAERPGQARETAWLVLRAQAGDRPALEALLERALALLQPYAAVMIADEDLRSDVLQEILVLLFRKLGTLREPRAFAAWARRIASREIFRALRRHRWHERAHAELSPELPAAEEPPAAPAGLLERLPALLERVSPASRAVLALHYLDGLTLDEVGGVLALPAGTVKSRLAYGLATLRRVLAAD